MPHESHPKTISGDLANPPKALTELCLQKRWLVWRWQRGQNGRWTKPPFCSDQPDRHAATSDSTTWSSRHTAVSAVLSGKAHGIGFVLTDTDIVAIDLDKCRDSETGAISAWAQEIVDAAPGAYVEITVSGTGLRCLGTGTGESVHRRFKVVGEREGAAIEVYRKATRYITVSGAEIGRCAELSNIDTLINGIVTRHDHAEERKNNSGNEKRFDVDGIFHDDIEHLIKNGTPKGQRSEGFSKVVWSLAAQDQSIDPDRANTRETPERHRRKIPLAGCASRYIEDTVNANATKKTKPRHIAGAIPTSASWMTAAVSCRPSP